MNLWWIRTEVMDEFHQASPEMWHILIVCLVIYWKCSQWQFNDRIRRSEAKKKTQQMQRKSKQIIIWKLSHTHKHARNIKRHPSYNNLAHLLFEEVTLVLDWHLLMLLADYALCMVVYGGFVFVCLLKWKILYATLSPQHQHLSSYLLLLLFLSISLHVCCVCVCVAVARVRSHSQAIIWFTSVSVSYDCYYEICASLYLLAQTKATTTKQPSTQVFHTEFDLIVRTHIGVVRLPAFPLKIRSVCECVSL